MAGGGRVFAIAARRVNARSDVLFEGIALWIRGRTVCGARGMFPGFAGGTGNSGIPDHSWCGGGVDGGCESGTRADEGVFGGAGAGVLAEAGEYCRGGVSEDIGSGDTEGCFGVEGADPDYVGGGVVAWRVAD